jgi:putative SOS response-associated peptidase YedK
MTEKVWGHIPHGAHLRPDIQPFNARAESVAEKPMFKDAYRKRRCIVPMDAFYEKKNGRLYKFFMKDQQPFGVAGIWENWRSPAGHWERTFCIIAVPPNELVRKIHDRMPAIIDPKDHQRWFDGADDLLVPYSADKMRAIPTWLGLPMDERSDERKICLAFTRQEAQPLATKRNPAREMDFGRQYIQQQRRPCCRGHGSINFQP